MEISKLILDHDAIERGRPFRWVEDIVFYIAAAGCAAHRESYRKRLEALQTDDKAKRQDGRQMDDEVLAESILLGWENISNNDVKLAYSYENSLWLLKNVSGVREFVVSASRADALFTQKAVEEAKAALKKS